MEPDLGILNGCVVLDACDRRVKLRVDLRRLRQLELGLCLLYLCLGSSHRIRVGATRQRVQVGLGLVEGCLVVVDFLLRGADGGRIGPSADGVERGLRLGDLRLTGLDRGLLRLALTWRRTRLHLGKIVLGPAQACLRVGDGLLLLALRRGGLFRRCILHRLELRLPAVKVDLCRLEVGISRVQGLLDVVTAQVNQGVALFQGLARLHLHPVDHTLLLEADRCLALGDDRPVERQRFGDRVASHGHRLGTGGPARARGRGWICIGRRQGDRRRGLARFERGAGVAVGRLEQRYADRPARGGGGDRQQTYHCAIHRFGCTAIPPRFVIRMLLAPIVLTDR